MPPISRQDDKSDEPHKDGHWRQAWSNPDAIEAGKKQALLNSLHYRIDAYRRKKKQALFIGIGAAAAILVAVFIKLPGGSPHSDIVHWRELASNTIAREMHLEDGSVLWLAPHSSIRVYPDFLQQRSAELVKGTVFFSVADNKEHPFSIAVNRQRVTVLGTAFTIHRLDSIDIQLTVKNGKVALDNTNGRSLLGAGERVSTLHAGSGAVQTIDPAAADWWLQQQVRWHNIALEEILNQIETYYQVKLSYGAINRKMKLTISWDMSIPLKDNLTVLNSLTGYNIH